MIPSKIIIHHSDSNINTPIEEINRWHKQRDFTLSQLGFYIGYHYVISVDGAITQTRKDWEMGCHCVPNNGKIGICLIGNFEIIEPRDLQLESLKKLVEKLKKDYSITEVWGHGDCNKTECPGKNLQKYVTQMTAFGWLQRLTLKLLMPKSHV